MKKLHFEVVNPTEEVVRNEEIAFERFMNKTSKLKFGDRVILTLSACGAFVGQIILPAKVRADKASVREILRDNGIEIAKRFKGWLQDYPMVSVAIWREENLLLQRDYFFSITDVKEGK